MARWQIADDNFYWFIRFTEHDYDEIIGERVFGDINLWPCRRCGAMVMGSMRGQHKKFHEKYPMEVAGDM